MKIGTETMVKCFSTSNTRDLNLDSLIMEKTYSQSVHLSLKTHFQSKTKFWKDFEEKTLKHNII